MLCAEINNNNSAVDETECGFVSLKAGQISADKAPSGCLHRAALLHLSHLPHSRWLSRSHRVQGIGCVWISKSQVLEKTTLDTYLWWGD